MRYQDRYPEPPLLDSAALARPRAAELLTLEYFEAEPSEMAEAVYTQHHVLLNLRDEPQRVENWRDGTLREFEYLKDEIILTPAGMRSGWRWHVRSKVIVITLEPDRFARFAQSELGVLLSDQQLRDLPQFHDADICQAGVLVMEALASPEIGSEVIFESLARVFLVKLIQKYGDRDQQPDFARGFTSRHYKRVLDHVATHYDQTIALEDLAREAALSPSHFSRLFKETIGQSPMQFVVSYRVEQAKKLLIDRERSLTEIAIETGFADQAHFTRVFKKAEGATPKVWREARDG